MDPNTPDDIEMNPASTAPLVSEMVHPLDDDDSMPELQSISDSDDDSDSDRDANEVEMQTVDDFDEPTPISMPPPLNLSALQAPFARPVQMRQTSGVRRTRVEDDDDGERDRRHPSQRINQPARAPSASASSSAAPQPQQRHNIPPTPIFPPPPPPQGNPPNPGMFEPWNFVQHFTPNPPAPQPGAAPPHNPQSAPGPAGPDPRGGTVLGGFAITIDLSTGRPVILNSRRTGATNVPHPGPNPPPNVPPGPHDAPPPGNDPLTGDPRVEVNFGELLERLGILGAMFGREREQEDPERAKKLVDGLEDVPIGLVRRLERVGLGSDEGVGGTGGDSGCAICWDRLLDGESEGFGQQEDKKEEGEGEGERQAEDSAAASSSSTPSDIKQYPKIVTLPCAHVFHASCLIPWFSRPNQTTCPTCRFNIDPENLTLRRRRRRFPMDPLGDDITVPGAPQGTGVGPAPPGPIPDTGEAVEDQNPPQDQAVPADGEARPHNGPLHAAGLQGLADPGGPPTANGPRPTAGDGTRRGPPHGFVTIGFDVFLGPRMGADDDDDDMDDVPVVPNGNRDRHATAPGGDNPAGPHAPPPPPQGAQGAQQNAEDGQNGDGPPPPFRMLGEMFGEVWNQLLNFGSQPNTPAANPPNPGPAAPPAGAAAPPTAAGGGAQPVHAPHVGPIPFPRIQMNRIPPPNPGSQPGARAGNGPRPTLPPFAHLFAGLRSGGIPTPGAAAGQTGGGANAAGGNNPLPFAALFGAFVPRDQRAAQHQHNHTAPPNPTAQPGPSRSASEPPIGATQPADGNDAAAGAEGANQNAEQNQGNENTLPPFDRFLTDILGFPMGMNPPRGQRPLFEFPPLHQPTQPTQPRPTRPVHQRREREKKDWTLPPAPGPTLRERVERKEREAGLRCHDMSCGIGPSDEDPFVDVAESSLKQLSIKVLVNFENHHQNEDGTMKMVCHHKFHPACLVSAERVAMMGQDASVIDGDVEVSCSVCRGHGRVTQEEWRQGLEALS